jgi:hypothetical protein
MVRGVMGRKGWTSVLGTIAVVAVVLSCGEIREDEMKCEESVSKLTDCCPNLDPHRFVCIYDQRGCNGQQLVPIFSSKASDCIENRTCDDLKAKSCDHFRELSYDVREVRDIPAFEKEACQ